ncbi:hypothetical protein [Streptacidiphilus jiangxiensis]|uniref:Uncharacterized protein n=1 Tax=Streptacidiphilus jiangxiensis TaxID=235985 RepID=A0A1H7XMU3_STRJI|nr:hypothetical protein [Streptacidiphilus jiangxiensis]SEM34507.1 hypothetical protein SAMN05414137_12490 [Streptacidiphilus jiangxiensis]
MAPDSGPARRRSRRAALGLAGALALTLVSCSHHDHPDRACLDTVTNKVVADQLCDGAPGRGLLPTDRYQWYEAGGDSLLLHGFHRLLEKGLDKGKGEHGGLLGHLGHEKGIHIHVP